MRQKKKKVGIIGIIPFFSFFLYFLKKENYFFVEKRDVEAEEGRRRGVLCSPLSHPHWVHLKLDEVFEKVLFFYFFCVGKVRIVVYPKYKKWESRNNRNNRNN